MSWSERNGGDGWTSILLDWIAAILLIALFLLAERFEAMPRGPEKLAAANLHAAVGMTACFLLAARIIWRMRRGHPDLPLQSFGLDSVAKIVHWLMLTAIAVLLVSGPLIIWSAGRGIDIFGLVTIPTPFEKSHHLHQVLEETHAFVAHVFVLLFILHVAGALKNLLLDQNGVSLRMLRSGRSST